MVELKKISTEDAFNYQSHASKTKLRHISDTMTSIIKASQLDPKQVLGYPTGNWPAFNQAFGGARDELIVITSETGGGKSSFCRNWIADTVRQGRAALLITLEDPINKSARIFSEMITGKNITALRDSDISLVAKTFETWPLYYLPYYGMLKAQKLFNCIDYAVETMGISFIVIDHLDYIEKDWKGRNESYVIGDCLRALAGKAHTHGITIVMPVHPSKRGGSRGTEIHMDDLKGSSSIKQEADAVFSLWRPEDGSCTMSLRLCKIRDTSFSHNMHGKIRFEMLQNKVYKETSLEVEWDD